MIEKNSQEAKIRKGSPARNPVCYQTLHDITIPAGTILRNTEADQFAAKVGFGVVPGPGIAGEFVVTIPVGAAVPVNALRKVIA